MIYFYFAKMIRGTEKIRLKATTMEMLKFGIAHQKSLALSLLILKLYKEVTR